MRYFLLYLSFFLVIIGCNSKKTLSKEELMEQENKETTLRLMKVFNEGKTEMLDSIVSTNYIDHTGGENGLEGYKRAVKATRAVFPDIKFSVNDILADSNKVFIRFTWTATHTKPYMGVDSTGKKISVNGMGLLRFNNGKMVERWNITDEYGLMQELKKQKLTF